jgi:hypothetical protein
MRRTLRRQCETRVRALELSSDIGTMTDVVRHVAHTRHRPIRLLGLEFPSGGPSGAWMATRSTDYLFYERGTSARHQAQIIAHELGHMISGHTASPSQALAPLLIAPDAARVMLLRADYPSEIEREAEQMADLPVAYVDSCARGALGRGLPPVRLTPDL